MAENLCLAVNAPFAMPILHPKTGMPILDDAGAPETISVLSSDSREAKAYNQAQYDARQRVARAVAQTAAEIEANNIDFLVALTKGWKVAAIGGKPCGDEYSPENARKLYSDEGFAWLQAQVGAAINGRANFMPASATS